ncbi:hypothetical protein EDD86DRAFT_200430 [Gorgonomyces haynaldii]|nr:hypothetical protein EDD86DRAFT_200430 [Gorgonomyces haynaldii]
MILISLWLVYGLEDQHQYEFYRRFQNVFQGSMLLFVSAVLLYSRYLAAREMKLASVEKRRSLSQKSPRNSAVQELGKIKIDRWKLKLIKNKISTIYIIMGIDSIMHAVVDDLFPTSYNLLFIVKIVDDILLLLIPALGLYWFQHGIIRNLRAAQLAQVDVEQRTSETDRDIVDEKAPFSQYYQPQRYSDSKRGSMQTNAPSRFQSIMSLRMVADPMEDDILYLVDKGYTREQAIEALLLTKCNLKKAEMLLR